MPLWQRCVNLMNLPDLHIYSSLVSLLLLCHPGSFRPGLGHPLCKDAQPPSRLSSAGLPLARRAGLSGPALLSSPHLGSRPFCLGLRISAQLCCSGDSWSHLDARNSVSVRGPCFCLTPEWSRDNVSVSRQGVRPFLLSVTWSAGLISRGDLSGFTSSSCRWPAPSRKRSFR